MNVKESFEQVVQAHQPDETDNDGSYVLDELKPAINQFLWAHLPAATTLGEADAIAIALYDVMVAQWEKADSRNKEYRK